MAQKTWEMSNNMETIQTVDEIYKYNKRQQQDILTAKPWDKQLSIIFALLSYKSSLFKNIISGKKLVFLELIQVFPQFLAPIILKI